jgi:beta-glucosidase
MVQLDDNVERILKIILQSPTFKGYKYSDKPDLKTHAKVSRMAAAQSMVLLKNDGRALPLSKGKSVAVFGNTSYNMIAGGTGSGDVNKAYTISLVKGLSNAGYKVQEGLSKSYMDYLAEAKSKQPKSPGFFTPVPTIPEMEVSTIAQQEANSTDAAIITIGRISGEAYDRKINNDFYLSDGEEALINNVATAYHAKGKKVIVVLNIGGVIEVASWRDSIDGLLLAWQPGQEAGNAIADVFTGNVNPSGKLATTFPIDYKDEPSANNFPGEEFPLPKGKTFNPIRGMPSEVLYKEGIYVGYRYFNSFNIKPAYAFGYGLSYTTFKFSDTRISSFDFNRSVTVKVRIENTGSVAGKEIAELYLSAPNGKIDKPENELKAFGKTALLAPGQSQTMTFRLYPNDLASFYTDKSAWIADAGEYKVNIGCSSDDFSEILKFKLAKPIVTEKTHTALTPQIDILELKKQ